MYLAICILDITLGFSSAGIIYLMITKSYHFTSLTIKVATNVVCALIAAWSMVSVFKD